MIQIGIFLFWLLHFLPLCILAPVGQMVGMLFYWVGDERRRVARTNLRLCFPGMAEDEREKLVRKHFRAFGRSFLERGILWWSPRERIQRLVTIEGLEHLHAVKDKPVILLAPHFVGLDMGWGRLATELQLVSMYSRQKNPAFNKRLLHARSRFGMTQLISRQEGIRPVVKALKEKIPFYYLPDMDYGARDAVFVPFFGIQAATITGLSRLARLTGAAVVPCITRQLPGNAGYLINLYPALGDFPGESVEADTRRMNACIEAWVLEMPEQYFWLHKRFKTRPSGEAGFYHR